MSKCPKCETDYMCTVCLKCGFDLFGYYNNHKVNFKEDCR